MNSKIVFKLSTVIPPLNLEEEFLISDDVFAEKSPVIHTLTQDQSTDSDFSVSFHEPSVLLNNCSACHQSIDFLKFRRALIVTVDVFIYTLVMNEMKNSLTFRKNFIRNFHSQYLRRKKLYTRRTCILCKKRNVYYQIIVYLKSPRRPVLDYMWSRRITVLVNEKCDLENAMAWFSTLGGAFSALGDTYIECAEKAGAISVQQMKIALRLGDPLTVCRCKIYMAMSLLQRGYFKKTKTLIRELYKFSTEGEGAKDFRLKNMCIAVWNRLKYLKSLRAVKAKES